VAGGCRGREKAEVCKTELMGAWKMGICGEDGVGGEEGSLFFLFCWGRRIGGEREGGFGGRCFLCFWELFVWEVFKGG